MNQLNLFSFFRKLLPFIAVAVLFSCKKDIDDNNINIVIPGDPLPIPAASPVTGDVSGLVLDENNNPVNGAEVKAGSRTTTTNANGLFHINNIVLDKYVSTVTVSQAGYFKAYRSFSATAARNFLNIKLIPKTLTGSFSSATADAVTLTNGTEISFQANSVKVKSTGAAYTGTVRVFANYIDPTSNDIGSTVPGSFMGADADNLYVLQSAGMIAVDLESDGGQELQLVNNKPASMRLPIPSSLISKAPATIDTWSLNEQGVWSKEGTATKNGNFYEMTVSHFSFWNCDVPTNAVYLTLTVQDQNGTPLPNIRVQLTVPNSTNWWATTYGWTNSQGVVSGFVPAAQALQMSVTPNPYTCATPAATQTIGPFSTNTSLTVTVTLSGQQTLTITGSASGCNGVPLANGTAIINAGNNTFATATVVNGTYSATLNYCSSLSNINVTVIDSAAGSLGSSGSVPVTGNSVTVPNIDVCGSQNAVFTFNNSGGSGNCATTTPNSFFMVGVTATAANNIAVQVNVNVPGSYSINVPLVNGIEFSASGIFPTVGLHTVALVAAGTPLASGSNNHQIFSGGQAGCTFTTYTYPAQGGQAQFNLSEPISCTSPAVSGFYHVGRPMDTTSNFISIRVNVTVPGNYTISTGVLNGVQFSTGGAFTTTGFQTVKVYAYGTPVSVMGAGFFLTANNGTTVGCSIPVQFINTPTSVTTFNCTGATVAGSYLSGISLIGPNTVAVPITVATAGTYDINTALVNGFLFRGSGTFQTTGPQTVLLTAQGVPTSSGTFTFLPNNGTSGSCAFTVSVN